MGGEAARREKVEAKEGVGGGKEGEQEGKEARKKDRSKLTSSNGIQSCNGTGALMN